MIPANAVWISMVIITQIAEIQCVHLWETVRVYNVQKVQSRLVNQWQCTTSSIEGREPQNFEIRKYKNTKVQEYKNTRSMSCTAMLAGRA